MKIKSLTSSTLESILKPYFCLVNKKKEMEKFSWINAAAVMVIKRLCIKHTSAERKKQREPGEKEAAEI